MMKKIILMTVLLFQTSTHLFAQVNEDDKKDWTLDPKTSTLVPKYLGKIKVLNGKAIIGERELKKGSKVYNNDLIQTMENSYLVMEMIDLTTVTLGPKSDFKVANWTYRTKNDREAEFTVLKGQWRALVRSKSKDDDQLKIKTPVVSMAIRGTELMVNVLKDKENEITQVALLEGAVHMETVDGKTQDLAPGDHAVIVKAEKGIQHNAKKLNAEDIKSFQQFSPPDVPRLLPPEKLMAETKTDQSTGPKADQKSSAGDLSTQQKKQQEKTVQENLKLLNETREQNLKEEKNK